MSHVWQVVTGKRVIRTIHYQGCTNANWCDIYSYVCTCDIIVAHSARYMLVIILFWENVMWVELMSAIFLSFVTHKTGIKMEAYRFSDYNAY